MQLFTLAGGSWTRRFLVAISLTFLTLLLPSSLARDACAAASFSSISGQIAADVANDSKNQSVSDVGGNSINVQSFADGLIDRASASVLPSKEVSGLFEFAATATSSSNGLSNPPNVARATSSASFGQNFQATTVHRVTMIATVSNSESAAATLQIANTQSPNSPLVVFGSNSGVEQYRSFLIGPGSYAISAAASSSIFTPGSSSGSVGGSISISSLADTSGDTFVNGDDLELWRESYGSFGSSLVANGDFNSNFVVEGTDFLIWQREFTGAGSAPQIAAVPSPSSALLASLAVAGLLSRGRLGRRHVAA